MKFISFIISLLAINSVLLAQDINSERFSRHSLLFGSNIHYNLINANKHVPFGIAGNNVMGAIPYFYGGFNYKNNFSLGWGISYEYRINKSLGIICGVYCNDRRLVLKSSQDTVLYYFNIYGRRTVYKYDTHSFSFETPLFLSIYLSKIRLSIGMYIYAFKIDRTNMTYIDNNTHHEISTSYYGFYSSYYGWCVPSLSIGYNCINISKDFSFIPTVGFDIQSLKVYSIKLSLIFNKKIK